MIEIKHRLENLRAKEAIRRQAKEEVFRDFDKHFKEWEDLLVDNYGEIKQRHLSNSKPKSSRKNMG